MQTMITIEVNLCLVLATLRLKNVQTGSHG